VLIAPSPSIEYSKIRKKLVQSNFDAVAKFQYLGFHQVRHPGLELIAAENLGRSAIVKSH
jgi:hypothetical protein